MTRRPARIALRIAALTACFCVMGCVATGTRQPLPEGPGTARSPAGEPIAPPTARGMIVLGKSTKADVAAALGTAIVIAFDSGYEVWVYRWRGVEPSTRAATELVVLYDPAGRATKARMRPGYETPDQPPTPSRHGRGTQADVAITVATAPPDEDDETPKGFYLPEPRSR